MMNDCSMADDPMSFRGLTDDDLAIAIPLARSAWLLRFLIPQRNQRELRETWDALEMEAVRRGHNWTVLNDKDKPSDRRLLPGPRR